jgi:hypothetical protein
MKTLFKELLLSVIKNVKTSTNMLCCLDEDMKQTPIIDCQCMQAPYTKVAPGADIHQETTSRQHNFLVEVFNVFND